MSDRPGASLANAGLGRIEPKKAVVRRFRRFTPIKTSRYVDIFTHLLGDALSAANSMKICVNLRNLRIELRFLG
jgi:hypothetical protein